MMHSQPITFRMPDLGLGSTAMQVSAWHATVGQQIEFRQRFVEVTAGDVSVDLPAPVSGLLAECCVAEDEAVSPGQAIAIIDPTDDRPRL